MWRQGRYDTRDYLVDHRVLYFQLGEIFPKVAKTFIRISFTRDQFAVAIPDVRQRSESIVFQLEEKISVVEGSSDEA